MAPGDAADPATAPTVGVASTPALAPTSGVGDTALAPTSGVGDTALAPTSSQGGTVDRATTRPTIVDGAAPAAALRARGDRYALGAVIGKGGMGEVCAARDLDIGRDVAIKRLRGGAPGAEAVARFLREARVQGRLDHPAIVPVHDLGVDADGRPYFAMKRLAGTTLAEHLARTGADATPRRKLLGAFVDVCLAIEFAHARGVVHRDLKPANITLGDYGEVYVLDWGIARLIGEHATTGAPAAIADVEPLDTGETQVGAVLGTPGYMAPEQVRGDADLGPAADVYALGAILHELLAGAPLHPRGAAAITSTLAGAIAHPIAIAPDTAPELDAACAVATAAIAADRPSARALGERVQRYLDGDRDAARRRALAAEHVAAAEAALVEDRGADGRARAMREAGRALALDPGSGAAALISRLMLEPPDETPAEVVRELAALDRAQIARQGKLAALALSTYAVFVPPLIWNGIASWPWFLTLCGLVAFTVAHAAWNGFRPREITAARAALLLGSNAAVIMVLSRAFGPYIIVPACALGAMASMISFPPLLDRFRWMFGAFTLGVTAPVLLELAGVWTRTTHVTRDGIAIRSAMLRMSPALEIVIALASVVLLFVAGRITWMISSQARDARRQLHVQAWHLRQVVPAATITTDVPAPRC